MGKANYDGSSSGSAGTVTLSSQVYNNQRQYIFQNSGKASWSSASTWTREGSLFASSAVKVYGTPYNWNATGSMNYGSDQYNFVAYENDYGVSADTADVMNNEVYFVANGGYGGSNWNNW